MGRKRSISACPPHMLKVPMDVALMKSNEAVGDASDKNAEMKMSAVAIDFIVEEVVSHGRGATRRSRRDRPARVPS